MSGWNNLRQFQSTLSWAARENLLIAISGGWFVSIGVRMIYPVLIPYIRLEYNLNLTRAGLLLTLLWISYALGQLPGGILTDRLGDGVMMKISTFIGAFTLILIFWAGDVFVIYMATILFGFGTALYGVARFTSLANIYPNKVGLATGISSAAGDAGNAILPPIAATIASIYAWKYGFSFAIPIFVVAGIFLYIKVPNKSHSIEGQSLDLNIASFINIIKSLRKPNILYGTLMMIMGHSIWQAFTGFYPTFLIEVKGLSPTVSSIIYSMFFAIGIIIKPITGGLYDKLGIKYTLTAVLTITGISIFLLTLVNNIILIIFVTSATSFLLGYGTVVMAYLTINMPQSTRGTGLGVLRTTYNLVASASPLIFGVLAERGFFKEGFVFLSILSLSMVIITLCVLPFE